MTVLKSQLYEQVARLGKALASPKRLELIELLCQAEKTVDMLAQQASISVKLASAHLKELKLARLVDSRRAGKFVVYRLASPSVADLWVALRSEAQERLVELQLALTSLISPGAELQELNRQDILRRAASGELIVLDVRPAAEFEAGHLPYARSIPVNELQQRLSELPLDCPVVAYCRGPFCMMAHGAVVQLRAHGIQASHLSDGVAEWRAQGLPVVCDAAVA